MQCNALSLRPVVQFVILAQWRHISSESAVELCYICVQLLLNYCSIATSVIGYFNLMWHLNDRNCRNCAINAPIGQSTEIAVLVILYNKPLVCYRSPEPQEALWHNIFWYHRLPSLVDPGRGARNAHPCSWTIFFPFHAVFGKKSCQLIGSWILHWPFTEHKSINLTGVIQQKMTTYNRNA